MAKGEQDNPVTLGFWAVVGRIVERLLSPHFLITVMILASWLWAMNLALSTYAVFNKELSKGNAAFVAEAKNTIPALKDAAVVVSGLFTTVLALVLGHYFGQQGEAKRTSDERNYKRAAQIAVTSLATTTEKSNAKLKEAKDLLEEVQRFFLDET